MDFPRFVVILLSLMLHSCIGQNVVGFEVKTIPEAAEQQFKLKMNRILTCMASATADNQKPTLQWEINGRPITATAKSERIRIEKMSDGNLMLRVDSVQDGDEGTYKCVATLGTVTDARSIKVEVVQELEIHSPPSQYGIFGTDGVVKCEATAKPLPTITWKFEDDTKIESGDKYVIQQDQLLIRNLNDADTKKYLCDILVVETGTSEPFMIDYQVVKLPKIDMPPTISPNNPKVGDPEVKITCHATGVPEPTYEFKKGDNLIPEDQVDEKNGILTIHNLRREDEAVYTCMARNRGGVDEKSNRLDVKIPPIIHPIPDVKDAVENGQQRVTCMAEGDPAPTVVWQKQGLPAYNDGIRDSGPELINEGGKDRDDAEIKTVGKTMIFASIKPQDAGTYVCTAINVVGNASQAVKFEVRFKPNFNTDFKDTVFYGWKGHTSNVTCQASANEVANIQWNELVDNRTSRIESDGPYTVTTQQQWPEYYLSSRSLMIYVNEDNSPVFKDYICEATNSMGTASHTVKLQRALPPGAPVIRVISVLSNKVTLEVDAPTLTGGQPVTGYRYTYHPNSDISSAVERDIDSTLATTVIELKDLKPNTPYVVRVSARNAVGLGTGLPVTFDTEDISKPVKLVIRSPAEGPEPNSYTLQWEQPDDGGSPITQFRINYRRVTVSGTEPAQWTVSGDIDKTFTTLVIDNPNTNSYTLKGLERDTFYDIRVIAKNKQGDSPEAFKIVKTSQGATSISSTDSGGVGSGVVIGIVVGIIVLMLVIAVVTFFILKKKRQIVDKLKRTDVENENQAKEDEKNISDEDKLIKEDTVKLENETGAGKSQHVIQNCTKEPTSGSKPENHVMPSAGHQNGPGSQSQDFMNPATNKNIKVVAEITDKMENPSA